MTVVSLHGRAEAAVDPASCAGFRTLALPDVQISGADWRPAGRVELANPAGPKLSLDLPAHCQVTGVTGAHADKAGRLFGVRFELRLPAAWNGRFLFQGGGGLDGSVDPAYGLLNGAQPALARGFAVASMDGGHEGQDASFATDQQARLDFAYQAVGKATAAAKRTVAAVYGAGPERSYFMGCSNGGREAMIAAERYPLEFDGVVAGDPGFRLSRAAVAQAWTTQRLAAIAPRDAEGASQLALALSPADLKLVSDAVLADCDALDGLRDGLINNQAACHFSPSRLRCTDKAQQNCLSAAKLDAIQAVFAGPRDSKGQALYAAFPYDTGVADPGWRLWNLGFPGGTKSLNEILGGGSLPLYFMTPPRPGLRMTEVRMDDAADAVAQTGALNDATSIFLTSFAGHGGKLLIYQGGSDPVFSAADIQAWYAGLAAADPDAASYARLFVAPGMGHCAGGFATDQFDALSAIQDWVEKGRAPERLLASGAALPGAVRPLCAFPAYARYAGGDPARAESFVCALPSKP